MIFPFPLKISLEFCKSHFFQINRSIIFIHFFVSSKFWIQKIQKNKTKTTQSENLLVYVKHKLFSACQFIHLWWLALFLFSNRLISIFRPERKIQFDSISFFFGCFCGYIVFRENQTNKNPNWSIFMFRLQVCWCFSPVFQLNRLLLLFCSKSSDWKYSSVIYPFET